MQLDLAPSAAPEQRRDSIDPAATLGLLMAAALAITPEYARAATPPDGTLVGIKYLDYLDYSQEGDRMRVSAPLLYLSAPLSDAMAMEASATVDSMSGASPEFHNTLSGASKRGIHDRRTAADAKLRRYFERSNFAVGIAHSDENDYRSNAANLEGQWLSANQNTTLTVGLGYSDDHISSENQPKLHETRHTRSVLAGLTQVLSPDDILQSNLSYSDGDGYFSDPYKALDKRPASRHQLAWLTRYNHYFTPLDAALHLDYRYYRDSWNVRSHTLQASWHQDIGSWSVIPSLRYYSQSAASFYSDRFPPAKFGTLYSADHRLGAFGALTLGVKLAKIIATDLVIDIQAEFYQQRSSWKLGGEGSPSLQPMSARIIMIGLNKTFR